MKLEFGNPEHIAKMKDGIIPEGIIAELEQKDGCSEGCEHCNSTHWECSNCWAADDFKHALILLFEGNPHCRYCNARLKE